ncbi:MAG TPA: protein-glutamate O-methyltransferase CheR [Polyangia bacterium]|jgi:chemotaxis protein methyltransferase CheR|nr:protein-glutamate O-methyltransferase CheR [Polyangia bacterium]
MPPLPMSPQVFSILSALVSERAGLHFDASHAPIFAEKVGARAVEAGFESLLDYYYFLRYDPDGKPELDSLVEALVVGETYLFRELAPLETTVADIVAPLAERGKRPRVWCAACATGEEPLTLAMLLAARGILRHVDLVASDISAAALGRARSGRFGRRSLRTDVPAFALPWLRVEEREIAVDPSLAKAIDWQRINLMDDASVAALGTFDAILCRNVLIYFSDDTVRRVVDRLSARLATDGALLVGISESLLRFGTPLRCEEQNGIFLYKKVS